ncbi:MAG: metallophosphoesterase [Sphingobacteriales bacterium]|nr:MAG: metallophosphoesterase [Sphingobacteriales bacterium]
MRRLLGSGLVILILILLDVYIFQILRFVLQSSSPRVRLISFVAFWTVSAISVSIILFGNFFRIESWPPMLRNYIFAILIGIFISKVIAGVFFMVDDVRRVVQWVGVKAYDQWASAGPLPERNISRSAFLSWLGIGLGTTMFGTLLYGFSNKYRYQVNNIDLNFDTLPESFKGLRIVHISDIHSGSFTNKEAVEKGVQKILDAKPDLILFTGDLVNDAAEEMNEYKEVFAKLTAPLGVYSTLGNHDYGDYKSWPSEADKVANLNQLKTIHAEMGWKLLMNEHVMLEREGHRIAVIGIENWGAKGFVQHGRLDLAYAGSEQVPFKILMSHDPSHWDAQVKQYNDIHLTLSGHTHGMQFGVEIPGLRWSPIKYFYKQWAGLYEDGAQKLYVNRGFGFIGYPGRVGIMPEITVINLV